jgi:hypothetical protein
MFRVYKRVTPREIADLSREATRLLSLGADAPRAEWDAFTERKIDVLNRIALDPGPFIDEAEAAEICRMARREALALRAGMRFRRGE